MKPRCILCRKPVPDNHTRCVKHWLNNQDQWMEDDQPAHEHCTACATRHESGHKTNSPKHWRAPACWKA